jgi:TonB family protein
VAELISVPRYEKPRKFHFEKGERYRHSGYVSFEVDENGNVSEPKIIRSTGARDVDNYLLRAVKHWKYKPAPGCGTRGGEADLTVDF